MLIHQKSSFIRLHFFGIFVCILAAFFLIRPANAMQIKLGGTGGDLGTLRILGAEFMKQHPATQVTVFPSLGSGGGIRAVAAGAIDLSISSRPLKEKERKKDLQDFAYGKTALVVATAHPTSLSNLTIAKLKAIYSDGNIKLSDGHAIRVILRPKNDGDTILVEKQVKGMAKAFRSAEAYGATISRTDQDAANALEKHPHAIGILSLTLVLGENRNLRVLPLDGIAPTLETIESGKYPLSKIFYMVTQKTQSEGAQRFIKFLNSPTGKDILHRTGHVIIR